MSYRQKGGKTKQEINQLNIPTENIFFIFNNIIESEKLLGGWKYFKVEFKW